MNHGLIGYGSPHLGRVGVPRSGLDNTTCIGCGGCIDVCPVNALSFAPIVRGNRISLAVVAGGNGVKSKNGKSL